MNEDLFLKIGLNVKHYRMNNETYGYLTQEQLSRISKVSISIIRGIESQKHNKPINLTSLNNIALSLNIPLYKFFM